MPYVRPAHAGSAMGGATVTIGAVTGNGADHANGAARASAVTGNGVLGVQMSTMHTLTATAAASLASVESFLDAFQRNGADERVATIVAVAKQAVAAKKGAEFGIFKGFLQLAADGVSGEDIQGAASRLRREVAGHMRVAMKMSRYKEKGVKEEKAPDYSTPSVYGKLLADLLEFRTAHPALAEQGYNAILTAKDVPPPEHEASGMFEAVGANRRWLEKCKELRLEEKARLMPSLYAMADGVTGNADKAAVELAEQVKALTVERDALAERVKASLQPGDAAQAVATAREEREAVRRELFGANDALTTAQAVIARQLAELEELRKFKRDVEAAADKENADVEAAALRQVAEQA